MRSRAKWTLVVFAFVVVVLIITITYHHGSNKAISTKDNISCGFTITGGKHNYCQTIKGCDKLYFAIARFYYCSAQSHPVLLLCILSLAICGLLVIILTSLSVLVSNFLFKNLHELSDTFGINHDILGFVLIPVTNALPDLINYYTIFDSGANDLVLGQIIGSVLIMLTIIVGAISIISSPFKVENSKGLFIDMSWAFFTFIVLLYILLDSKITLTESLVMVLAYVLYIAFLNSFNKDKLLADVILDYESVGESVHEPYNIEDALSLLPGSSGTLSPVKSPIHNFLVNNIEYTEEVVYEESVSVLQMMLNAIDFIYLFLVPMPIPDDHELWVLKYREVQFDMYTTWFSIEVPMLINYGLVRLGVWDIIPVIMLTMVLVYSSFIFIPKAWRISIVNITGVVTSTIIISAISKVVLCLLKNFGLLWKINDYLLGLFVFSVSNSVNDIVTNVTISTKINPILGINACLGTPLLLILLGLGVNSALMIARNGGEPLQFNVSMDAAISIIGLLIIMTIYIVYLPINSWVFDKRLGIFLIAIFFGISGLNLVLKDSG